jgi:hypothetical protein
MNGCLTEGCDRTPRTSSGGSVYPYCPDCTAAILRDAFSPREPEPTSWHALARAHRLPPLVIDGTPA